MLTSKNQAIDTALKGDWEKAIELNENLLSENPEDVEALNRSGLAYTILGQSEKARKAYQKVLEIDPLNSIALKNIKKFSKDSKMPADANFRVNNTFLEETGKTKVIDLVNIAQPEIIANLRIGQAVELTVKRLKIFITNSEKHYLGVLPDDIGKRLIKFISGGNKYEAFVRSSNHSTVTIFIREVKRSGRFKDQPSFLTASEKIVLKKGKNKKVVDEKDYEEEEPVDEPEEES